jgi:hypothetical protein
MVFKCIDKNLVFENTYFQLLQKQFSNTIIKSNKENRFELWMINSQGMAIITSAWVEHILC